MQYFIINRDTLRIEKTYELAEGGTREWIPRLAEPICVHLPIPENLDPACIKAVLIDSQITLVEDPDKVAAKAQAAKEAQIAALKASFDADVDAEMFVVYGTWDRVVAGTTNQSWNTMLANPTAYVPAIFPTVEALQAYIAPKATAAIAFDIWRIGRLAQRDAAIAAL